MHWREKLRLLLKNRNASELSRNAGLNPSAIGAAVSKGTTPSADKAVRIAEALGVSADWLFDDLAEWPPPPPGAASLGDFELVEELARRRQLIIQDMKALASQFAEPEKMRRLEALAEDAWRGGWKAMGFQQQETLKTAYFDLGRIRLLEHRISMMNPENRPSNEHPPSLSKILARCPRLSHGLSTIPASSDIAVMTGYEGGGVTPVYDAVGDVVDREKYISLGAILQRRFVPVIDDTENGPPSERPILIYEGQSPPTRFNRFIRCDVEHNQAFGYYIRDSAGGPKFPKGSVIVCEPGEPDRSGKSPALVVYDSGRKSGVFFVKGHELLSASGSKMKLRPDDRPTFYPVAAGPFSPASPVEPGDKKSKGRKAK